MGKSLTYIAYRWKVFLWLPRRMFMNTNICIYLFIYMWTENFLCRVKFSLLIPLIRSASLILFCFLSFRCLLSYMIIIFIAHKLCFCCPSIQFIELPCYALSCSVSYVLPGLLSIKTKDLQHKIDCQAIVQQ